MPFVKGKSGNDDLKFTSENQPENRGRPKGVLNTRTRLLRWLTLELDEVNPATGKKERATILEKMDVAIIKKALSGDLNAYKEIIDRLEGQSAQTLNVQTPFQWFDDKPIQLPDEERTDLLPG